MLDSILIAALTFAPVRPSMVRTAAIAAPTAAQPVLMASASAIRPEFATTCHLQTSGSCWSEK